MTPEEANTVMHQALRAQSANRYEEACALYERIRKNFPRHAGLLNNLAAAKRALGDVGGAISCLEEAIAVDPRLPGARVNLLKLYLGAERAEKLVPCPEDEFWQEAVDADMARRIGAFFFKRLEFGYAADYFQRAVNLDKDDGENLRRLGRCLIELSSYNEAAAAQRRALSMKPNDTGLMVDLVRSLLALHLIRRDDALWEEARDLLSRTLEVEPDHPEANFQSGLMLEEEGDFEGAAIYFQKTVKMNGDHLSALTSLTANRAFDPPQQMIDKMLELAESDRFPPGNRSRAFQTAGKRAEESENYDDAFVYFSRANALSPANEPYDPDAHQAYVSALIESYPPGCLESLNYDDAYPSTDRFVFIVGMPRSGTTLLEQILASHPDIAGGGELTYFVSLPHGPKALHDVNGRHVPEWDQRWRPEFLAEIAQEFSEFTSAISPTALRVIDKMPFNFLQVGAIAAALPKAVFLYAHRTPQDVGVSCFVEAFNADMPFAQTLDGVGHYLKQHARIIDHWRDVVGERFITVSYEALLDDFEPQATRALNAIGTDWHPACATYFETKRSVRTPSKWQVRQPLYKNSIDRWRRYESHLGPMLKHLTGSQ